MPVLRNVALEHAGEFFTPELANPHPKQKEINFQGKYCIIKIINVEGRAPRFNEKFGLSARFRQASTPPEDVFMKTFSSPQPFLPSLASRVARLDK